MYLTLASFHLRWEEDKTIPKKDLSNWCVSVSFFAQSTHTRTHAAMPRNQGQRMSGAPSTRINNMVVNRQQQQGQGMAQSHQQSVAPSTQMVYIAQPAIPLQYNNQYYYQNKHAVCIHTIFTLEVEYSTIITHLFSFLLCVIQNAERSSGEFLFRASIFRAINATATTKNWCRSSATHTLDK